MKYDHIVVGGGTAGCIVATKLAEDPAAPCSCWRPDQITRTSNGFQTP
ncbi:MAG: hypothetical protein CM1200mP27_00720 [Chloroflexota bacterium]|nr:MAG: hypothetical protein CM1200mP27_00720 [Chloroflexota bacterium]